MTTLNANSDGLRLGALAPQMSKLGFAVGGVLIVLSALMGFMAKDHFHHFLRAYIFAYMVVVMMSLGSLFLVLVMHVTRTGWGIVLRRIAEGMASNLMWLPLGFLPVLVGMWASDSTHLYHWAVGDAAATDEIIAHKSPYLNPVFWTIRAFVFWAVWAGLARYYSRNSVLQDSSGDTTYSVNMMKLAPLALLLFAVTQTFASIDWIKSLDPHWFSTMFGVYQFAASCCGAFSMMIIIVYFLQRKGKLQNEITLEHWQDMGKLLFAFGVCFWAYIAFSQYMLIWYANIPEETAWYIVRRVGEWKTVSWVLTVGHFMIPFVAMMSRHVKRKKPVMTALAAWMLLLHIIDVYWLVMPIVDLPAIGSFETMDALVAAAATPVADGGLEIGWAPGKMIMDLTLVAGFLALFIGGTARALRDCALVPVQDPRVSESMAFENM